MPSAVTSSVEIVHQPNSSIEVGLVSLVFAGGGSGDNLGGFPVVLNSPQENDVLQLKSGVWTNINQTAITTGGTY